ncbi:hypothetical protein DFP93_11468 [Aneurinibacillus soli]|uniref:Uncharacterized protein n=1 Tax=Aneurinibacillus soli TaxID=1500254 RepID=A0A0U5ARD0_9BACL|nr:DUF5677 domain-containing protein [Aneurinibacillus soli]PYE60133.1 hypothetical protein DFP93_11468 [Aneurinibacillus soli]BAU26378.1 hypothetical protein CB4_00505 [Aneurinibacillus soli]
MSEEQGGKVIHIPAALERCKELFSLTDQYIDFLYQTTHHSGIPEPTNNTELVKIATLLKINGLVVLINLLLRHDHWEEAKILNRSLFELLLHTEEIFRVEKEIEKKVEKFLLFNELQEYRKIRAEIEYDLKTDRFSNPEKVQQVIDTMDLIAKKQFRTFLRTDRKKNLTYWENEDKEIMNEAILMLTFAQETLLLVLDICPNLDVERFLKITADIKEMVHRG